MQVMQWTPTATRSQASQEHVTHGSPSISTELLIVPARRFAPAGNGLRRGRERTGTGSESRRIDGRTRWSSRGAGRGRSASREPRRRSGPGAGQPRNEPSEAYRESIRRTVEKRRHAANRGQGMGDPAPCRRDHPLAHAPLLIIRHTPHGPRRDRESPGTAEEVNDCPSWRLAIQADAGTSEA